MLDVAVGWHNSPCSLKVLKIPWLGEHGGKYELKPGNNLLVSFLKVAPFLCKPVLDFRWD